MRKTFAIAALAAALAGPLAFGSTDAYASCQGRKNTGTVIGGVGGALLGNSISKGGGGAVIGGLGGAVLGHEVAKSGCRTSGHANYRSRHSRYANARSGEQGRKVYYDQHGDAVVEPGSRDHR